LREERKKVTLLSAHTLSLSVLSFLKERVVSRQKKNFSSLSLPSVTEKFSSRRYEFFSYRLFSKKREERETGPDYG